MGPFTRTTLENRNTNSQTSNHALQRTRPSRLGYKRTPLQAVSLNVDRSPYKQ